MNTDNLVHMANRIGEFFQAMPDQEAAGLEVAQHLRKFWAPRMRSELLAHVELTGGAGLLPLVQAALRAHRALLLPAAAQLANVPSTPNLPTAPT